MLNLEVIKFVKLSENEVLAPNETETIIAELPFLYICMKSD